MTDSQTRRVLSLCDQLLEAPVGDRDALLQSLCGDDMDLRRGVESVLGAVTMADRALGDQVMDATQDLLGQSFGAYTLTDVLGEGGMGAVYRAHRAHDDFSQTVAVKIIRGRFLSDDLVRRFNAERTILARLNHPYVAQLIDGGTEQGVPYLVMEYIDGTPVDQYLDDNAADLNVRIRMVQKVAMAVHAAHQNLVVHRDLKPGNVLVTADGIPKLLDFGIAKLVGADDLPTTDDATRLGGQALTPNYASPEQILHNRVTTLSDVYSLGVLAYELLAGERPYQLDASSQGTLIDSVGTVEIPRASTRLLRIADATLREQIAAARSTTPARLAKSLRGDLDNILAKALAPLPEDRYSSVAAFSADLSRYAAGEPVEAHADSWWYRAQRLVARNRGVVLFSAALVTSLIVGLAATTWSYLQAERAREQSAQRFDQVRSLAKTMMFDVYDDIAKVPGTVTARAQLAGAAQTYLQTLAADAGAPLDVQLDAAQGFSRLYTILNRDAVDDADDRERAQAAWDKAHAILSHLTEQSPPMAAAWHALGALESNRAQTLLTVDSDPDAARDMLAAARARLARARQLDADNLEFAATDLTAQVRAGEIQQWSDAYAESMGVATDALAAIQAARSRWPDAVPLLVIEGDAYQVRGESAYWIDDYAQTMPDYANAIAAFETALELGGPDQAIEGKLSNTYWSRGNAHIDQSNPTAAAKDYEIATQLVQMVAARDPDDTSMARRLAILRASRAMALVNSGDGDTAIALMQKTHDWFEEQADADSETPGPQRSLAISYYMMGDIYRIAERDAAACEWFAKALDSWLSFDARFGIAEFDAGQPDKIRELIADCGR
ncbi:MAG: protein kinase [Pseudomonadota bacterium]